jgi:hypothetical protein
MELDQLLTTLSTRAIRELAAAQSTATPVETMTDDSLFDETGIVAAFYEGQTTTGAYHYACVIEDPGNFGGYRLASFYVTDRTTSITGDWGGNGYATNPHEDDHATLLHEMEQRKDAAYLERNQLVAALARLYPAGIGKTDIPGWSPDWHNCVYIETPIGQLSWHYHDSHAHLFSGLPAYWGKWDGHTTEEKYRRLSNLGNAYGVPVKYGDVYFSQKKSADAPWPFPSPADWPKDLTTFQERLAYQRGVHAGSTLEASLPRPRSEEEVMYEYLRKHMVAEGYVPREVHHVMRDPSCSEQDIDDAVKAAMQRRPL